MNFICRVVGHRWVRRHYPSCSFVEVRCERCDARPYEDTTLPEWWRNYWRFTLAGAALRVRIWFKSRPCWVKDHQWSPTSQFCLRCGQSGEDVAESPEWTLPQWKKLWRGWLRDLPRRIFGAPFDPVAGKWYLAGPMSNRKQFNIPAFDAAAKYMRSVGFKVISPAELDEPEIRAKYLASPDGDTLPNTPTWGTFLSRDVKIVADDVRGVILLPEWELSRGARLEAYVGLLCGHDFVTLKDTKITRMPAIWIKLQLWRHL